LHPVMTARVRTNIVNSFVFIGLAITAISFISAIKRAGFRCQ
jgi:hypothetical protein